MEFEHLLEIVGDEPLFESGLLLAGSVTSSDVRRQLSRWARSGRIIQLRRGLYCLAPPFRKVRPHPFVIANHLVRGSYVSLQSALAYRGLIPEAVPVVVSVTARRPGQWHTPLGSFIFRHIQRPMFDGYRMESLPAGQHAFVATPEKALLDLVYLEPGAEGADYLAELRLQQVELLDLAVLRLRARRAGSTKLARAVTAIARIVAGELEGMTSR